MSGHPVTFPSAASLLGHAHLLSFSQSLLVPEPSGLFEETLQGCALSQWGAGVTVSLFERYWCHPHLHLPGGSPPAFLEHPRNAHILRTAHS